MNKDQLASVVASEVGLSQSDAKAAVEAVFDGITNGMKLSLIHISEPTRPY